MGGGGEGGGWGVRVGALSRGAWREGGALSFSILKRRRGVCGRDFFFFFCDEREGLPQLFINNNT